CWKETVSAGSRAGQGSWRIMSCLYLPKYSGWKWRSFWNSRRIREEVYRRPGGLISPGLLYFLLLFAGGLCYNKTENNLPPYGGGSENIYDRTWKEAGASGSEICGIRSISGRKSRRGREEPRASSGEAGAGKHPGG